MFVYIIQNVGRPASRYATNIRPLIDKYQLSWRNLSVSQHSVSISITGTLPVRPFNSNERLAVSVRAVGSERMSSSKSRGGLLRAFISFAPDNIRIPAPSSGNLTARTALRNGKFSI